MFMFVYVVVLLGLVAGVAFVAGWAVRKGWEAAGPKKPPGAAPPDA